MNASPRSSNYTSSADNSETHGKVLSEAQHEDEEAFLAEFNNHKQHVKEGDLEKATQSFIMLQANGSQNEIFKKYLVEMADHIDPNRDSDMSRFFASLPALIQSTIVENATAYLEETDMFKAFQILFDYIQAYPRHAYKYLIRAIDALTLHVQSVEAADNQHREKCIRILVTDLLQRLWKQRILLTGRDRAPSVKSTDSKHYIVIPYNLFEHYMLIGQRYYIQKHDWSELVKFTCAMLDCCGYAGLGRLDFLSHTNRFQYMKEQRPNIRLDTDEAAAQAEGIPEEQRQRPEDLHVLVAFMCEFMAATSQFVQFGYDYYKAVCVIDDSAQDEKACLIPICAIQPGVLKKGSMPLVSSHDDDSHHHEQQQQQQPLQQLQRTEHDDADAARKRTIDERNEDNSTPNDDEERQTKKARLDEMLEERGQGLDAYCMKGVDEALQILSKAGDCLRHLVDLWQWAAMKSPKTNWITVFGGWEEELCRVIDLYKLPFDVHNSVLLVRSDLALSSPSVPGNLGKALDLSQSICDRIEVQRRQEKTDAQKASSEYDIPFMFAFRVLYNISVIYLLVGSLQQSTLEIAIILSVFPIPNDLEAKHFVADEMDCRTVATVFKGHEFGLMRVTQEGLVVRCMKHLIVSLDNQSEQRTGMASIDSAMKWDDRAGNMIVLMQYGWPYWSTRTNFWHNILRKMQDRRTFKNREFLEYIYVPEILQSIRSLHETEKVIFDIIPPEFALRSSYRALTTTSGASTPSSPQLSTVSSPSAADHDNRRSSTSLPSIAALTSRSGNSNNTSDHPSTNQSLPPPPPPIYQPSFTNTILPSMSMSPTWYSASTQKNAHANWMSPSFYYSRPATSVMLPVREPSRDAHRRVSSTSSSSSSQTSTAPPYAENTVSTEQLQRSFVPKDIVTRCLEYRVRRHSPNMTPQRMRHVLQKFLKKMVLKANKDV